MSDTGAAPDNSGGSSTMNMMGQNGEHPMQMYQTNFTGSSLAQYQAANGQTLNGPHIGQQFSSQDKKRSNKMNISKNNVAAMRFNMH
jgi:hypothetical protein